MARLIDWLSWKYNVLFIVSAGNCVQDIELGVASSNFVNLTPHELQASIIEAIADDTRNRRLLAPAETFNGLTVAATHEDATVVSPNALIDPFVQEHFPSVINAQGPGYRRTIKPDILLPGGRQCLSEKLGNNHPKAILEVTRFNSPPGQRIATPGTQGELTRTSHTRGTSNSAALASRSATLLHEVIENLRHNAQGTLLSEYDAVLLKALLAHGSSWSDALGLYEQVLKNGQNSRRFKEYVGRFLGYGPSNVTKVMSCTDQRVTVLGVGALLDGSGDEFTFPLPPSLSATAEWRRLTVTLAWFTPVSNTRQNYRIAHLWFNPTYQNVIAQKRLNADYQAVQRGTLQHEVLEGYSAIPYQDGDNIAIRVNCRADAGNVTDPVRYALAVTLEVAEETNIPIYEEIRDRLAARVQVQGRV